MEDKYTIQQPRPTLNEAKDFSKTGKDYKKMLAANEARTEESATKNSNWAPGALKRLKAKTKKVRK